MAQYLYIEPSVKAFLQHWNQRGLSQLLFTLWCANVLARPILGFFEGQAADLSTLDVLGINLFTLIALAVMAIHCNQAPQQPITLWQGTLAVLMALTWLIPSTQLAWVSGIGLALIYYSCGLKGLALLCMILSFREPSAYITLQLFAQELLSFDAWLVSLLLNSLGFETSLSGNVVQIKGKHQLLILTGCGTFSSLYLAVIGWFALSVHHSFPLTTRQKVGGLLLVISIVSLNILRLSMMALDRETYTFLHDGDGANLYPLATTLCTLGISLWANRRIS